MPQCLNTILRPVFRCQSVVAGLLVIVAMATVGCELLPHALQPSQLRKLNRGPELGRDTSNFSVPDPDLPVGADPFRTE